MYGVVNEDRLKNNSLGDFVGFVKRVVVALAVEKPCMRSHLTSHVHEMHMIHLLRLWFGTTTSLALYMQEEAFDVAMANT